MSSKRKAIRKAIRNILLNKTEAKDRVFTNQSTPSWVEDLPVILIYSRSEDNEVFNESPREWKRTVNMAIECIAVAPESPNIGDSDESPARLLDDLLDDIADKIELELSRDDTLNCTADDINLSSTEFDFEGDGQMPVGSVRLIYQVTYYTNVPANIDLQPEVSDYEQAGVEWNVGHDNESPDENIEANDVVDIPQN